MDKASDKKKRRTMKTAKYRTRDGKEISIEYDEKAPCIICGEPVVAASMGGTVVCPWCDTGRCRYCGVRPFLLKEEFDGGKSLRNWREHMAWHKAQRESSPTLDSLASE